MITKFSRSRGDSIALSRMKFEVLEDIDFKLVKTKMQFKSATRSSANTIAYARGDKVKLYFDVYGAKYWMGDGGIFAVLKDQPEDVHLFLQILLLFKSFCVPSICLELQQLMAQPANSAW